MEKFIMALVIIMLVYLCVYAVINRVCKCIEHHTEHKYPSWEAFPSENSDNECCRKEENPNVRNERDSV